MGYVGARRNLVMAVPKAPVIGRPDTPLFLDLDAYNGVVTDGTGAGPWNWISAAGQTFIGGVSGPSMNYSATAFDGKPAFVGLTNRSLYSSPTVDLISASSGAITFMAVFRSTSLATPNAIFGSAATDGWNLEIAVNGTIALVKEGKFIVYDTVPGVIQANTKYAVIATYRPGGATTIRVNSVQAAQGANNVASTVVAGQRLVIGRNGTATASRDLIGQITTLLVPQGGGLSQSDEIDWERYLNSRWSVY